MLEKWTIIYIEFRYRRLKSVNGCLCWLRLMVDKGSFIAGFGMDLESLVGGHWE